MKDILRRPGKIESFFDAMPFGDFDPSDDIFQVGETGAGVFWEIRPKSHYSNGLDDMIRDLVQNILPEHSFLQIGMMADPRISHMVDKWQNVTCTPEMQRIRSKRAFTLKNCVSAVNFRGFVSFSIDTRNCIYPKFQSVVDAIEKALQDEGFIPKRGNEDAFLNVCDFFFDPSFSSTERKRNRDKKDFSNIKSEILKPSTSIWSNGNENIVSNNQNERSVQTLILQNPDGWSSIYSEILAKGDLDFPFFIEQKIHIPPQKTHRKKLQSWTKWMKSFEGMSIREGLSNGKSKNPTVALKQIEADRIENAVFQKDQRLVFNSLSICIVSNTKDSLKNKNITMDTFRKRPRFFNVREEKNANFFLMKNHIPMALGGIRDLHVDSSKFHVLGFKTTTPEEVKMYTPIIADPKGHDGPKDRPHMQLLGKGGHQLFNYSPFSSHTNFNVCVVGIPGSGKSFLMQDLFATFYHGKTRAFVIDSGRSFESLCKINKNTGQFIEFSDKSDLCLNPFSMITDLSLAKDWTEKEKQQDRKDSISMIVALIEILIHPEGDISDLEHAWVEKAVIQVVSEKGCEGRVSDVQKIFYSSSDQRKIDLGDMLQSACPGGAYEQYFEGDANISFEKDMVVIELQELETDPRLQAIIMQLFIMNILKHVFLGDRSIMTLLEFDEAWGLFKGKAGAAFIESAARKIRKCLGAIVCGTQNVEDFFQSPAALAALNASYWRIFMQVSGNSADQLKKNLNFDDRTIDLIKNIKPKKGVYSELVITGGTDVAIPARFIVDPFSAMLYSTTPGDTRPWKKIRSELGLSIEDSIENFLKIKQYSGKKDLDKNVDLFIEKEKMNLKEKII